MLHTADCWIFDISIHIYILEFGQCFYSQADLVPKIVYNLGEKCQYKNNNFILVLYTRYLFFLPLWNQTWDKIKKQSQTFWAYSHFTPNLHTNGEHKNRDTQVFDLWNIFSNIFLLLCGYTTRCNWDYDNEYSPLYILSGNICFKNLFSHMGFISVMTYSTLWWCFILLCGLKYVGLGSYILKYKMIWESLLQWWQLKM